jgi:hypothetical protein
MVMVVVVVFLAMVVVACPTWGMLNPVEKYHSSMIMAITIM